MGTARSRIWSKFTCADRRSVISSCQICFGTHQCSRRRVVALAEVCTAQVARLAARAWQLVHEQRQQLVGESSWMLGPCSRSSLTLCFRERQCSGIFALARLQLSCASL